MEIVRKHLSAHGGRGARFINEKTPGHPSVVNADVNNAFYPPSPAALAAIHEFAARVNQLPDPSCEGLRSRLAALLQVQASNIEIGNGSSELLQAIITGLVKQGESAVILDPTYGEYNRCLSHVGADVRTARLFEEHAFRPTVDSIMREVDESTRMIIICNPNNPSGQVMSRVDLLSLLDQVGPDVWVVLDEAYIEFSPGNSLVSDTRERPNLFVVRTFSKAYALSGLRIGYVVMGEVAAGAFSLLVRPPWPVGLLAMIAAEAALEEGSYTDEMLAATRVLKGELVSALNKVHGIHVLPSETNFFLVDVEGTGVAAPDICRRLEEQMVFVRDCASFGESLRDRFIRVTTQTGEGNQRILGALESALKGATTLSVG
jgi:histidinol-phosphate aminotransferase